MAMSLPSDIQSPSLIPAGNSNASNTQQQQSQSQDKSPSNTDPSPTNPPASPISSPTQAKRKPSRRANTAERRATHNAVERQRRETLNGRFLVRLCPFLTYPV